jgi:hypothetical protein
MLSSEGGTVRPSASAVINGSKSFQSALDTRLRVCAEKSDARGFCRLLRARRERPRGRSAAEQPDELPSSYAEHGLLPGTRCARLQQAQDAPEAPAGPWGRPESF